MSNYQSDILRIGAGAAGIAAVAQLAMSGLAVNIIEAGERIGGRIYTRSQSGSFPIELGAEVVHGKTMIACNLAALKIEIDALSASARVVEEVNRQLGS